jgi:hypothetical protein
MLRQSSMVWFVGPHEPCSGSFPALRGSLGSFHSGTNSDGEAVEEGGGSETAARTTAVRRALRGRREVTAAVVRCCLGTAAWREPRLVAAAA